MSANLKTQVAAAVASPQAFGELVAQYQDLAIGFALGRLGDRASALDAAQDAFIDAFEHLGQLREPEAFPGWLRRIVAKHCDRQIRRRKPAAPACEPSERTPESHLEAAHDAAWIHDAVEWLPEHERLVVAIHYLGEITQRRVADFLELPLTTVKKRLHSARGRLKRAHLTPPKPEAQFAERVRLFLEIRAGDVAAVEALIAARPELLEAEETWSDAEALQAGLPLAHRLTPLILAARLGNVALVDRLLALGAAPDGRCGCDNSETALWAAVRGNSLPCAARLLAAGADANAQNARGVSALHLAAAKDHSELTALLRAHGAVPVRDDEGRLPADWAPATSSTVADFGIKALTLLAPLKQGDLVRVEGAAETGLYVLLCELTRRFVDMGGHCVWVHWESERWHRGQLDGYASDSGVEGAIEQICASTDAPRHTHNLLMRDALDAVRRQKAKGPVALFVFESEGQLAQIEGALPHCAQSADLTFVIRPWVHVSLERQRDAAESALAAPYDVAIVTDERMAQARLFPALHPLRTRRREADPPRMASTRAAVEAQLEAGVETPLLAYLSQPFVVAQVETGWPGGHVAPEVVMADIERLQAAATPDVALLRYRDALPADLDGLTPRTI